MSDLWQWFFDREYEYQAAGDKDRLRMAHFRGEAFRLAEHDPAGMVQMYKQARDLAKRLNEPWWVFLYEVWLEIAYENHLRDLDNALKQALHCVNEARKPILREHPWREAAYNNLLGCYVLIDPVGYADAIRDCIAHLEQEIPQGPGEHRYMMMVQECLFWMALDNLDEAQKVIDKHLGLFDQDRAPNEWYAIFPLQYQCWIDARRGNWAKLRESAKLAESMATGHQSAQLDVAQARMWAALAARRLGEEADAARRFRLVLNMIQRLEKSPCPEHYDALAWYHESGGELDKALEVREQQLAKLAGQGRHGHECETHLKRCELLARLGRLTKTDVHKTRDATNALKNPEGLRARLGGLNACS